MFNKKLSSIFIILFLFFVSPFVVNAYSFSADTSGSGYSFDVGGSSGAAVFDSFGGLGSGVGQFSSAVGGSGGGMTEAEYKVQIEVYVGMYAGEDLSNEEFIQGLYTYLGVTPGDSVDLSTPEYTAFTESLRSGDTALIENLAQNIAMDVGSSETETGSQTNINKWQDLRVVMGLDKIWDDAV